MYRHALCTPIIWHKGQKHKKGAIFFCFLPNRCKIIFFMKISKSCHISTTSLLKVVLRWHDFNVKKWIVGTISVQSFSISHLLKVVSWWHDLFIWSCASVVRLIHFCKKKNLHQFGKKGKKLHLLFIYLIENKYKLFKLYVIYMI